MFLVTYSMNTQSNMRSTHIATSAYESKKTDTYKQRDETGAHHVTGNTYVFVYLYAACLFANKNTTHVLAPC